MALKFVSKSHSYIIDWNFIVFIQIILYQIIIISRRIKEEYKKECIFLLYKRKVMNIIINSKYLFLKNFIESLPETFNSIGNVIQKSRNVIKRIKEGGVEMNIKRFRRPHFINRIAYTFFLKTKAYKAYNNAIVLTEKGFNTPAPIAYIELFENGLLSYSYFISLQLTNVKEIRDNYFCGVKGNEIFLSKLARYSAQLHKAGVLHLDYSPGNILINEEQHHFILVDINRMKFKDVSFEEGCASFCRLFEKEDVYRFVGCIYAQEMNWDKEETINKMIHYKRRFETKKRRKAFFKRLLRKNK